MIRKLYMATLSPFAITCSAPIYERLLAKGNSKKVALTAAMRKLLIILRHGSNNTTDSSPSQHKNGKTK